MIEKSIHVNKTLYVAFMDLEKAFDNVERNKMFGILEKLGIDYNDRRIIHQLYKKQVATMRMRDGSHIEAKINKGVRQGCNLSPALFNIYMEGAMREAQDIGINGIKINGDKHAMLRRRYCNDSRKPRGSSKVTKCIGYSSPKIQHEHK
jgi:hypothetical protein